MKYKEDKETTDVTLKDNFVASKPHTKLYRSCKIVAI
jgi:hypothetical protein